MQMMKCFSFFGRLVFFCFFKSSSGTCASSLELLNIGDDDDADVPSVQEDVPPH